MGYTQVALGNNQRLQTANLLRVGADHEHGLVPIDREFDVGSGLNLFQE